MRWKGDYIQSIVRFFCGSKIICGQNLCPWPHLSARRQWNYFGSLVGSSHPPHLYIFILILPPKYFISDVWLPDPAYLELLAGLDMTPQTVYIMTFFDILSNLHLYFSVVSQFPVFDIWTTGINVHFLPLFFIVSTDLSGQLSSDIFSFQMSTKVQGMRTTEPKKWGIILTSHHRKQRCSMLHSGFLFQVFSIFSWCKCVRMRGGCGHHSCVENVFDAKKICCYSSDDTGKAW